MNSFTRLARFAAQLPFEEYDGRQLVDDRGHYQWKPSGDFAFAVKLLSFRPNKSDRPLTWHEYLELFIPIEGRCRIQIGRSMVSLAAGDLLVMDNLKLHVLRDFSGERLRVIVFRFLPELIYSTGSFSVDHLFCMPFYHQVEGHPHVVRGTDEVASRLHNTLIELLECYFDTAGPPYSQAGAKVFFLEVLYHLARRFQVSEALHSEYVNHRERSQRLRKLFDFAALHYAEKITVSEASALVGMSRRRFLEVFRTMADMTWVEYLNDVRLTNGAQLLKKTTLSIAEIAAQVGYADQSYFNRRFKQRFGHTPVEFRRH